MSFHYDEVVPWGRSLDEYRRMFRLTDGDLRGRRILGCADGPASFNAELSHMGIRLISCDPLYLLASEQIKQRFEATYEEIMRQVKQNQDRLVWDVISSPDELGRLRLNAMNEFLADYDQGRKEGRYVAAQLPDLPFAPHSFDLALCSHLLFFYSDILSFDFHQKAVEEMCRVATEVRIFPLVTYNAEPSPWVTTVVSKLRSNGWSVSIDRVPYQFQRDGNMMMRIY